LLLSGKILAQIAIQIEFSLSLMRKRTNYLNEQVNFLS